jgi:hypothetical protein
MDVPMMRAHRPLLAAVAVVLAACSPRPPASRANHDSSVLRAEEIAGVADHDAYTLVQSLRPQWLRAEKPQTVSGNDRLVVYFGAARIGGLEALRQISAADVGRMEFLSPSAAQLRFGSGHLNGAIVVTPLLP